MEKRVIELTKAIPGWLSTNEGRFLRKASKETDGLPGEVVEIGSYQGKSTIWLAQAAKKVWAVDPHKGKLDEERVPPTLRAFKRHLRQAGVEKRVVIMRKTSEAAAEGWKKPIRLLFIDGLHDYKNAKRDFELWSSYLVEDGMVAMHDAFCGWKGAEKVALEQIVGNNAFGEIGVVGSTVYGVKGKSIKRWPRRGGLIRLAVGLYRVKWLPELVKFFLIHRVIKSFLLNRFTWKRD